MKRHSAFTLIELLVVISIIALLIGILLPALGTARETAKKTHCLSGLKQISIGSHAYAADHDGQWPLRFRGDPDTTPYWPTYPNAGGAQLAQYSATEPQWGFGALYASGYVSDTKAMYCISMEDAGYNWGSEGIPYWDANAGTAAAGTSFRSAYAWNPHVLEDTSDVAYTKVDFHPADKTLVSDLITNFASAHSNNQPTFNITLADGSARVGEDSQEVYDWSRSNALRGWGRIIDVYDALEGYGWSRDAQAAAR